MTPVLRGPSPPAGAIAAPAGAFSRPRLQTQFFTGAGGCPNHSDRKQTKKAAMPAGRSRPRRHRRSLRLRGRPHSRARKVLHCRAGVVPGVICQWHHRQGKRPTRRCSSRRLSGSSVTPTTHNLYDESRKRMALDLGGNPVPIHGVARAGRDISRRGLRRSRAGRRAGGGATCARMPTCFPPPSPTSCRRAGMQTSICSSLAARPRPLRRVSLGGPPRNVCRPGTSLPQAMS